MNQENIKSSNSKIIIRVVVIALIAVAVIAIWYAKNMHGIDNEIADNQIVSNENYLPLHINEKFDLDALKSYGLPIMIDFGADSCAPCLEMAPVLKRLHKELQGKAIIIFADIWKYPEIAEDYPIRVIPTQIFIDSNGEPYTPSDPEKLQMNLYTLKDTDEHILTTHEGGMNEAMILYVFSDMGLEQ